MRAIFVQFGGISFSSLYSYFSNTEETLFHSLFFETSNLWEAWICAL